MVKSQDPFCQFAAAHRKRKPGWSDEREQLLAGVPYFFVTFTVPEPLRAFIRQHQRLFN